MIQRASYEDVNGQPQISSEAIATLYTYILLVVEKLFWDSKMNNRH